MTVLGPSSDTAPTMRWSKTNRSAITNGNRQFALGGDGRGAWVRRWRDLTELHMVNIGDEATLSEGQKSLCRRAATLEVNLEQLEAKMSEDQGVDLDVFNRLSGNLRRIFETLGLDRRARDINRSAARAFQPGHPSAGIAMRKLIPIREFLTSPHGRSYGRIILASVAPLAYCGYGRAT